MAQLPEIQLTCRNEHTFTSRARGGTSISCPVCRPSRVSVWVSRDRPRTEREARERAARTAPAEVSATDPGAGSELADRWEREATWPGNLVTLPGRPADECGECDGPLQWEPGRTVVYCSECKGLDLPAAVTEHYRRQDERSAEVATRSGPDQAAERAARVRVRALAQRMSERVAEWVEAFDPDGLNGNAARLALDYQAEVSAYLPEIRQAKSQAELADIMAEVTEVTDRAQRFGVLAEIERQREAIERQAEHAEREAEWEAEQVRLAAQAERQAAIEARAERRAIEPPAGRRTPPIISAAPQNGYLQAGVMLVSMIEKSRAEKERKLAEHGPCGYQHKKPTIPARRYWLTTLDWQGNQSGHELPDSPSIVVCSGHFGAAGIWIEQQAALIARQRGANVAAVYTELK